MENGTFLTPVTAADAEKFVSRAHGDRNNVKCGDMKAPRIPGHELDSRIRRQEREMQFMSRSLIEFGGIQIPDLTESPTRAAMMTCGHTSAIPLAPIVTRL